MANLPAALFATDRHIAFITYITDCDMCTSATSDYRMGCGKHCNLTNSKNFVFRMLFTDIY